MILFPGRRIPDDFVSGAFSKTFRDDVVKFIATRIDKRHLVYDYAVSPENVVFVPRQDENVWKDVHDPTMADWSAFIIVRLYQPDLTTDAGGGMLNVILQGEWQMYPDGNLRAIANERTQRRIREKIPGAVSDRMRFGLQVGEAADDMPVPAQRPRLRNQLSIDTRQRLSRRVSFSRDTAGGAGEPGDTPITDTFPEEASRPPTTLMGGQRHSRSQSDSVLRNRTSMPAPLREFRETYRLQDPREVLGSARRPSQGSSSDVGVGPRAGPVHPNAPGHTTVITLGPTPTVTTTSTPSTATTTSSSSSSSWGSRNPYLSVQAPSSDQPAAYRDPYGDPPMPAPRKTRASFPVPPPITPTRPVFHSQAISEVGTAGTHSSSQKAKLARRQSGDPRRQSGLPDPRRPMSTTNGSVLSTSSGAGSRYASSELGLMRVQSHPGPMLQQPQPIIIQRSPPPSAPPAQIVQIAAVRPVPRGKLQRTQSTRMGPPHAGQMVRVGGRHDDDGRCVIM